MRAEKRRAGRRIRKQRREVRRMGEAFTRIGQAGLVAYERFAEFATVLGKAMGREEQDRG